MLDSSPQILKLSCTKDPSEILVMSPLTGGMGKVCNFGPISPISTSQKQYETGTVTMKCLLDAMSYATEW